MPDFTQTALGIACGQMGEMVLPTGGVVPSLSGLAGEAETLSMNGLCYGKRDRM
jgi:hypothetical protein